MDERDELGLAVDQAAAQAQFISCMEDAGHPVADMTHDEYTAFTQDPENPDFRWADMHCHEEAGTGWFVGNRDDEVAVLNDQAASTTNCMREKGWQVADPIEDEFGRFLRFNAEAALALAPSDEKGSAQFSAALVECLRQHAIDWSTWRHANPRN